MGRVLQIRVIAQTFDVNEVHDNWPWLVELAWGRGPVEDRHGVLELARTLADKERMGMLPANMKAHQEALREAETLVRGVETALGDWKAGDAERLSTALETLLDELEKKSKTV
ncbi:MAG: hypothetical protein KKB70_01065 [Proteobacteria bacterium]|nr:hypothetical protein [Pseudomonadota bacterium]MBU1611368.1 hypothetical protein [Pseudomonadota bacterium]